MKALILGVALLCGAIPIGRAQIIVSTAQQFQDALNNPSADSEITINGTLFGRFVVNRSGTPQSPLIIQGGTISGASGTDDFSGLETALLAIAGQSNIRIENVNFVDHFDQGAKGIYVTTATEFAGACQNIYINACSLSRMGWSSDPTADPNTYPTGTGQAHGILVTGRTAETITNVNITNTTLDQIITGNSETLTINGNVDGFLIQANTISNVTNIGIDVAGGFGVATAGWDQARNGKIIENTVFNCRRPSSVSGLFEPAGIYVDGGVNIEIYKNRSYQNGQGFSIGSEQAVETTNIVMTNNVSYFNAENGLVFGGNNGMVTHSLVRNNTFYQNGLDKPNDRSGISIQKTSNASIINNIVYEPEADMFGISFYYPGEAPLVDYNLVYGMATEYLLANVGSNPNGIIADPQLNTNLDFIPYSSAPVIDAGSSIAVPETEKDFVGAHRISGSSVDIGAREFQNALGIHGTSQAVAGTNIRLYPNPAHDFLSIQNLSDPETTISIYDLLGRLQLRPKRSTQNQVSIQTLSTGFYIVVIDEKNRRSAMKFFKK